MTFQDVAIRQVTVRCQGRSKTRPVAPSGLTSRRLAARLVRIVDRRRGRMRREMQWTLSR